MVRVGTLSCAFPPDEGCWDIRDSGQRVSEGGGEGGCSGPVAWDLDHLPSRSALLGLSETLSVLLSTDRETEPQ